MHLLQGMQLDYLVSSPIAFCIICGQPLFVGQDHYQSHDLSITFVVAWCGCLILTSLHMRNGGLLWDVLVPGCCPPYV